MPPVKLIFADKQAYAYALSAAGVITVPSVIFMQCSLWDMTKAPSLFRIIPYIRKHTDYNDNI